MKRICVFVMLFGLVAGFWQQQVFAQDMPPMFERNFDFLDFTPLDEALVRSGNSDVPSFGEIFMQVITGEVDLSPMWVARLAADMFFGEISAFSGIMRNILIIAVLSAILKNLTDSFTVAEVGNVGFAVLFALMVVLIFQAFSIGVNAATAMISTLSAVMMASIPVLIALLVFSGNLGAPLVISPTLAFYAHITVVLINYVITPLIVAGVVMTIVNCLSERNILKNFSELIMAACGWGLKLIAFSFGLVLALQKIASPIAGHLVGRTARTAVEAVPIVGSVIGGAADMVAVWAQAARSGMLVALVIIVGFVCFATIMKLVMLVFMFKLTAALIAPICDKRLVDCINSVGNFSFLLLGCVATVVCMVVMMAVILLSF